MPPPSLVIGAVFGLSETALALFKRSGGDAKNADAGSLRLLWIGILLAVFASMWVRHHVSFGSSAVLAQAWPLAYALFALGVALRWWSIIRLGRYFTVNVAVARDQPVIDDGPYRFLRHPSYSGALTAFVGYGIALQSWLALAVLMVPITLLFLRRIHIEERALAAGIGEPYVQYMRRTWRLLPFLY